MGEIIRRALHEIEDLKCRLELMEEEQHPDRLLRALDTVWDRIPAKPLSQQFDEMCAESFAPCDEENIAGEGI